MSVHEMLPSAGSANVRFRNWPGEWPNDRSVLVLQKPLGPTLSGTPPGRHRIVPPFLASGSSGAGSY